MAFYIYLPAKPLHLNASHPRKTNYQHVHCTFPGPEVNIPEPVHTDTVEEVAEIDFESKNVQCDGNTDDSTTSEVSLFIRLFRVNVYLNFMCLDDFMDVFTRFLQVQRDEEAPVAVEEERSEIKVENVGTSYDKMRNWI